jgi:hypothetical protein
MTSLTRPFMIPLLERAEADVGLDISVMPSGPFGTDSLPPILRAAGLTEPKVPDMRDTGRWASYKRLPRGSSGEPSLLLVSRTQEEG